MPGYRDRTRPEPPQPGWRPTAALVRALAVGAPLLLAAVLLRRPDLAVLAAPLLLGAALGLAGRPHGAPRLRLTPPADALLEGGRATAVVTVETPPGVDAVAVELALPPGLRRGAGAGVVVPAGTQEVGFGLRATRWGRRPLGPATATATAGYGLLSWPAVRTETATVATWPLRETFDASDSVPRAEGLVGGHRSHRPGEGGDVAGVRPFVPGDRLRRINWRVTGRTGALHVTSTYSDRDTEVLLVLDSGQDLGRPPDSALDTGVRAAAAVAEHYLRAGDRVALVDLARPYRSVPARNGRGHLIRLLDLLLDAAPSRIVGPSAADVTALAAADALVVLLSPLATADSLAAVAALARSGRSVVTVDTLPPGLRPDERSEWSLLAFRLWRLRRDADVDRLRELGVPVVPWQGAGSLDAVLRDAARAARAPKVTR